MAQLEVKEEEQEEAMTQNARVTHPQSREPGSQSLHTHGRRSRAKPGFCVAIIPERLILGFC